LVADITDITFNQMDLDFAYMVIAVQSAYSINGKLLWIAESFFLYRGDRQTCPWVDNLSEQQQLQAANLKFL